MKYAIITGDIVGSSKVRDKDHFGLVEILKQSFEKVEHRYHQKSSTPSFDIFRGDSFQGAIDNPVVALESAIMIRAGLRQHQIGDQTDWDARIAIGIGEIDYLPDRVSEGDGPAYRSSGPVLDNLGKDIRLAVQTPWSEVNEELNTECSLLDAIISKWTPPQAEVVFMLLEGKERKKMSEILGISQAAIHYRIKGSGWFAIEKFIKRYHTVIHNHLA